MIDRKEKDLEETHRKFITAALGDLLSDSIYEICTEDIMGFGTTTDEVVFGIDSVKALLDLANDELKKVDEKAYDIKTIWKKQLSDDIVVMTDLIDLRLTSSESVNLLPLRVSYVFKYIDNAWKVSHWHGSMGVDTEEGDTWHLEEWKEENKRLQQKVDEKTVELKKSIEDLKATQAQLIHSEKMASLGELTAGIAHEIKNPLNFINNFSELNSELIEEVFEELHKLEENDSTIEIRDLLGDVSSNLKKIYQHGSRADNIVKSMLQHSRGSDGIKTPIDFNELIKEYVNLAFHGMRAGKKPINVSIVQELDDEVGFVPLISEDISRVLVNLCNNAFDAMHDKLNDEKTLENYQPTLIVRTISKGKLAIVEIEDNGSGIIDDIKDKILQPFFTTKKGTEGTGLGLSITNDIIRAHGGSLSIESEQGKDSYTKFRIELNK